MGLFVLAGLSLVLSGDAWASTHHLVHRVVIDGMKFTPQALVVHSGDTVVWENEDLVPHTVTASNKSFDSKSIEPGKSFYYKTRHEGTFHYSCRFHPTMTGTLIVK